MFIEILEIQGINLIKDTIKNERLGISLIIFSFSRFNIIIDKIITRITIISNNIFGITDKKLYFFVFVTSELSIFLKYFSRKRNFHEEKEVEDKEDRVAPAPVPEVTYVQYSFRFISLETNGMTEQFEFQIS